MLPTASERYRSELKIGIITEIRGIGILVKKRFPQVTSSEVYYGAKLLIS